MARSDEVCTATTNGLEAVEAYAADPAAFDVVLLGVQALRRPLARHYAGRPA